MSRDDVVDLVLTVAAYLLGIAALIFCVCYF